MFWTSHIAKPEKWTPSTFLPTSILTILVIMHAIRGLLLKNPESPILVEMHKLNVYGMQKRFLISALQQLTLAAIVGPGSFFKSHVDTPKGCKMFGSLVVVLPTKHEGGSFSFRHHGRGWIFN